MRPLRSALAGVALFGAAFGGQVAAGSTPAASERGAVRAAWVAFFSGKTTAERKVNLLEDGKAFAAVIRGQAGSGLARSASAKVTKVKVGPAGHATVTYTVYLGGQPALKNEKGQAVKQGGRWKVSSASFCRLLALEQVKVPACAAR